MDEIRGVEKSSRQFAVLPYLKSVMEHIQQAFKKHDIKMYSKEGYTVRNSVVSPNYSHDMCEQCGVIYQAFSGLM